MTRDDVIKAYARYEHFVCVRRDLDPQGVSSTITPRALFG
jgi:hypothetical protein